jgi:large subunit ribosomal protein L22
MTGPKLNEGATVVGERAGTKATAKYVRSSARKARVVLDLIRGVDVRRADEILQFTDRGIARDIRKVLASAVANAVNNDLQDADELFVLACFADEGPTLRRFRPRARGRASRIRKRTCHITVIVARMSDDRLAVVQARQAGGAARPSSSAASRRARVERSRQRAQAAREGVDAIDADETAEDAAEELAAEDLATETDTDATDATDDVTDDVDDTDDADVAVEAEESADSDAADGEVATTEYGEWEGSVLPLDDGSGVTGFEIKGNASSMLYHEPGTRYYDITKAEVYFDNVANAEAAGFARAGGTDDATDAGDDEETK